MNETVDASYIPNAFPANAIYVLKSHQAQSASAMQESSIAYFVFSKVNSVPFL